MGRRGLRGHRKLALLGLLVLLVAQGLALGHHHLAPRPGPDVALAPAPPSPSPCSLCALLQNAGPAVLAEGDLGSPGPCVLAPADPPSAPAGPRRRPGPPGRAPPSC